MTKFENTIMTINFQLILKGIVPTIYEQTSMVDTYLVAMPFDKIIFDLLGTKTSGLRLSANDLSYIWGRYVPTNEQDKYIFRYAYHAVKLA